MFSNKELFETFAGWSLFTATITFHGHKWLLKEVQTN